MSQFRTLAGRFALAAGLLAALAVPAQAYDRTMMERFFAGRTTATGTFSAINGLKRKLTITVDGRVHAQGLKLTERIAYDDGARETKTWHFRRTGPDTYRGTREDVIGYATVRVTGNVARFSYDVDLDPGPKQSIYRFYDRLEMAPDGRSLSNSATVFKALFPVASVHIDFRK
ncbi:hypothetical protein BJF93_23745 [Xaviernesmea oryzae]|uniref:DUF3833 domain-containing protein n=1 Tax=Xaviernesmea oryzae TaxID=464029 RepID=A0A1Q9B2Y0_9HYPH|nr:DUF3833 family protein [Xaviernesmea oryzae]OLP62370.1 hypothetical protein BJF93_23745 [Xaviernesmea oryzae]SEL98480.1 Protein of unknown function [Xaviernesmea oryzae]